jgi:hypothetical protein
VQFDAPEAVTAGTPVKIEWRTQNAWGINSFENWRRWGQVSSLNFQVKFYEASGDFEFHYYGLMSATTPTYADGTFATAWMENLAGTAALVITADKPGIVSNSGYRFTYVP